MSQKARALIIGLLGPVIQAIGVTWDILDHAVFDRRGVEHLTLSHIFTGPAHLIIFTGFALSVVCIPFALQVMAARLEDLEVAEAERPQAEDRSRPLGRARAIR